MGVDDGLERFCTARRRDGDRRLSCRLRSQDALAPTPTIYLAPGAKPIIENAQASGNDDLSLVYVTDRAPITDPDTGALSYRADRSRFMSFGSVDVHINQPAVSSASNSSGELKVGAVSEVGKFPEEPYAVLLTPKGYRRAPEVVAAHKRAVAALQGEIRRRIARTQRKEVVVFIHGYNNTFKDAVTATEISATSSDMFCLRRPDMAGRWIKGRIDGLQRRSRF